jgi:uncharacterized protein YutE (UPF0331/DUF86 family)
MTSVTTSEARLERELVDRVAQKLVGDGYEVRVEPGPGFLPGELAHFRPDILATRGDENLVVEVKLTPDPAAGGPLQALAEAVRKRPGWRFELVTAPRDLAASPWTIEEAAARVDEAEELARAGHEEAALLLLVAVAEAVGRRLGEIEGLRMQRWNSRAVPGELVHHGLVDQRDADLLDRAQRLRNLVVHGARGGPGTEVDVGALAGVARRLLAEVEVSRAERAREEAAAPAAE